MYEMINFKYAFEYVFFLGDVHGDKNAWLYSINSIPNNSLIIQVGDGLALGFQGKENINTYDYLQSFLEEKNITILTIRGNHENPKYWEKTKWHGRICLAADYETAIINNKRFQFVGGAISIDQCYRTPNIDWWLNEKLVLKEKLCRDCDVLVMHTAPNFVFPVDSKNKLKNIIAQYSPENFIEELAAELIVERNIAAEIFNLCSPSVFVYGHFHDSNMEIVNGCRCHLLGINEIKEINF